MEANLTNSDAEIQISRVLKNSKITMKEKGDLKLLLSEDCQSETCFDIKSKSHHLDPSIKLILCKNTETSSLIPTDTNPKRVTIDCEGHVNLQSAAWINMLRLGVK